MCLSCDCTKECDETKLSIQFSDNLFKQVSTKMGINRCIENTEQSVISWFSKYENYDVSNNITWGFSKVDEMCALTQGTIALIAGYTGVGKSTYIQHTLLRNIAIGNTVLYFHLKENCDTLISNIIAAESFTKLTDLQCNTLSDEDWKRIALALRNINFDNLKLIPFSVHPPMAEQVLDAVENSNARIIIIDDFNALGFNDNSSVECFLYQLKAIASKSHTTVLILSSISQNIGRMDKRPLLQDIQYDGLYRICDIVKFIYRVTDDFYETIIPNCIEIIVAKNQLTNITGTVELATLPDRPVICSVSDNAEISTDSL